jgi:hypothetical protein
MSRPSILKTIGNFEVALGQCDCRIISLVPKLSIAASPAPPKVAQQIYVQATLTKMCLRYSQGDEAMEKTLAWAEGECEGFMRS